MKNIIQILSDLISVSNEYFQYTSMIKNKGDENEESENEILTEYEKELEALGNELSNMIHEKNNINLIKNTDIGVSISRIAELFKNLRKNPNLVKNDIASLNIEEAIDNLENLGVEQ